jgi:hypothetical protein
MSPHTAVKEYTPTQLYHLLEKASCELPFSQSRLFFAVQVEPEEDLGWGSMKHRGVIGAHVQDGAHARLIDELPPCARDMLTTSSEDLVVHPGQIASPTLSIQPPFDDGERADYTLDEAMNAT